MAIKVVDNTDKVLQAFKTATGARLPVSGLDVSRYT